MFGGNSMSWLTDAFAEQSVVWLIISTVVAIIAGFLSSWLTYHFKRQEIIDSAIADLEKKRQIFLLEMEKSRVERVRQEVIRWANPILGAVGELIGRLGNILEHQGYLALSKDGQKRLNPDWSMSYDYFMSSTLYLFGQYFAWVQMLQEKLNFELFQSQKEKDKFFEAIKEVGSSLSGFPPKYQCSGKDTQVFRLQQRAIGELLIIHENDRIGCLSYPNFLQKMNDPAFSSHLKPLRLLLEDLNQKDDCRWKRLEATQQALKVLKANCEELLRITSSSE